MLIFKELKTPDSNALKITAEDACSATVGYSAAPNANVMHLGQCFLSEAFVKHELGHAVGPLARTAASICITVHIQGLRRHR